MDGPVGKEFIVDVSLNGVWKGEWAFSEHCKGRGLWKVRLGGRRWVQTPFHAVAVSPQKILTSGEAAPCGLGFQGDPSGRCAEEGWDGAGQM